MGLFRLIQPVCLFLALQGARAHAAETAVPPEGPSRKIQFRLPADPATLDWNMARTSHETYIIMNLMEGLVEEGPDLKPRPSLAERWEISPDGKTYTFFLRAGVRWSDGRPLKASDFEDSWFRLLEGRTHSNYANFLFEVQGAEAYHDGKLKDKSAVGIKALSDGRFQVKLRRRLAYFLHLPTFWVTFPIRLDLIKKYGDQWTQPGKIVTLGPYLLTKWNRGASLELKRNPDYLPPPNGHVPSMGMAMGMAMGKAVELAEVLIEANEEKARTQFEGGQLDFLLNATTEDLLSLRGNHEGKDPRMERFPYLATYYLGFNVRSGTLKDPNARKAIALAIDLEGIPSVLQGGQTVARSWLPPEMEGLSEEPQLTGSLYDARAALALSGHPEGQLVPKLSFVVEKFDGAEAVSQFIAKSVREKLGVTLEPRIGSPAEFQRTMADKKASLFLTHWGADVPDPVDFFRVFTSSSGTNYTGWSSPVYDEKVELAQSTDDGSARQAAYSQAEEILLKKEVVILPLFYKRNTVLLGERIDRFQISPLNYLFLKDVTLK